MSASGAAIRIAVASDLHAYSDRSASPSHLHTAMPETLTQQHPIAALIDLIKKNSLTADYLISPGDLGDKADADGIIYAWGALGRVSQVLGCKLFTATAGNHDLDSRFQQTESDPAAVLRGLVPSFPLHDETLDDKFWSRSYVIYDDLPLRLVLLNSSAYHGYTEIEKNHGRIGDRALSELKKDLANRGSFAINVLLCHHHPHQHSELSLGERDVMKQGQQLLDLLGTGEFGKWLVVHGHKHHPKIGYAAGSASSPVVFAAGSLSAMLTGPLQTAARNQFYIIELHEDDCATFGLAGTIRAWDFYSGKGWVEAPSPNSGLPASFGFGVRQDPRILASDVAHLVSKTTAPVPWGTLSQNVPELKFLIPQDTAELMRVLKAKHGLTVEVDGTRIVEVGRLA